MLLFYALILRSFLFSELGSASTPVQRYHLEGKYGLFVSRLGQQYKIKWITSVSEEGRFSYEDKGGLYKSLVTPQSIVHSVTIPVSNEPLTITFGGASSEMEQIRLDPDIERDLYDFKNVDSLYVLGDTHGNFEEVLQILQSARLINQETQWIGGSAHLVFLGDILDRGNDALRLAWFIYELEQSASENGGSVHLVLGNHEVMVMSNDLRYVTAKEKQIAVTHQVTYNQLFDPQQTYLGKWLASKPALLKIDKVLFCHGGMITGESLAEVNNVVYNYLQEDLFTHLMDEPFDSVQYSKDRQLEQLDYLYNSHGPLWFRGYVQSDTLDAYLTWTMKHLNTSLHVVGHTIVSAIQQSYDGKLIATNVTKAGTEMLLLIKEKKSKYSRFKIGLNGEINPL